MFSKIIVNSPWYLFLASVLFGLGIAGWLYFKNRKDTPGPVHYLMFTIRAITLSFLCFLLLGILLRRVITETENPVILVAIDNSSSMLGSSDSEYVHSRLTEDLNRLEKKIGSRYEIKTILFGDKAAAGKNSPGFSEKETDIDNLLSTIDNNYANLNIGALVVATDGIYNKGANPVYSAQKLTFPIYAIAIGDTNEIKDIAIIKVNHNQVAYLGNDFPVEVVLNGKKFAGQKVLVSLYQKGILKGKQEMEITSDAFTGACTFTLNAQSIGVVTYEARVAIQDGETNVLNNSRSFVVEVIDNREKVLLLANVPHPDLSALKESISQGTTYELEYAMAADFKRPVKPYSLVIIHGYSSELLQVVNECRNNNVPYWMVNPLTAENLPGVKITGGMNRYNDAEPVPAGTFGLFNISPQLQKFIGEMPAVKTFFGNYNLANGAEALVNQKLGTVETGIPILLFNETNGLKTALFAGDGLWKWRLRDFSEHKDHQLFNELISKTVQYLSVKSDKSFFRLHTQKIFNENQSVEMDAEVYNKSYEPVTDPDVQLVLTNVDNKKFNYTFSKSGTSYRLNLGLLPAGEYRYAATVKYNNEIFSKQGILMIKEVHSEKLNTVANHRLLYQMADRTEGKVYYPSQIENLEKELLSNEKIKAITYSQNMTTPLIELKWIFWLALTLLSVEWFFRKRYLAI